MKTILQLMLGTAFVLFLGGEAMAQTPAQTPAKTEEVKTTKQKVRVEAKQAGTIKAVPGTETRQATGTDEKKSKVRTRAIAIDEEGVNEEAEEERPATAPSGGTTNTPRRLNSSSTPR